MRRTLLLVATMSFAVLAIGGVARAAVITCESGIFPDPCLGTPQNDVIRGSQENDLIFAFAGIDRVKGRQGDDGVDGGDGGDQIAGAEGADSLLGDDGNDVIRGGPGTTDASDPQFTFLCGPLGDVERFETNQLLNGEDGDDRLVGGDDSDSLFDDAGRNNLSGKGGGDCFLVRGDANERVSGGDGGDIVDAIDGTADDISCGAGIDAVRADEEDRVAADCEQVFGPSSLQAR